MRGRRGRVSLHFLDDVMSRRDFRGQWFCQSSDGREQISEKTFSEHHSLIPLIHNNGYTMLTFVQFLCVGG